MKTRFQTSKENMFLRQIARETTHISNCYAYSPALK
jgi:hypothetical protein